MESCSEILHGPPGEKDYRAAEQIRRALSQTNRVLHAHPRIEKKMSSLCIPVRVPESNRSARGVIAIEWVLVAYILCITQARLGFKAGVLTGFKTFFNLPTTLVKGLSGLSGMAVARLHDALRSCFFRGGGPGKLLIFRRIRHLNWTKHIFNKTS